MHAPELGCCVEGGECMCVYVRRSAHAFCFAGELLPPRNAEGMLLGCDALGLHLSGAELHGQACPSHRLALTQVEHLILQLHLCKCGPGPAAEQLSEASVQTGHKHTGMGQVHCVQADMLRNWAGALGVGRNAQELGGCVRCVSKNVQDGSGCTWNGQERTGWGSSSCVGHSCAAQPTFALRSPDAGALMLV